MSFWAASLNVDLMLSVNIRGTFSAVESTWDEVPVRGSYYVGDFYFFAKSPKLALTETTVAKFPALVNATGASLCIRP